MDRESALRLFAHEDLITYATQEDRNQTLEMFGLAPDEVLESFEKREIGRIKSLDCRLNPSRFIKVAPHLGSDVAMRALLERLNTSVEESAYDNLYEVFDNEVIAQGLKALAYKPSAQVTKLATELIESLIDTTGVFWRGDHPYAPQFFECCGVKGVAMTISDPTDADTCDVYVTGDKWMDEDTLYEYCDWAAGNIYISGVEDNEDVQEWVANNPNRVRLIAAPEGGHSDYDLVWIK